MSKYVSISVAAKTLGVSIQTLRRWDEEGTLVADRTPKNHRRYDLSKITPEQIHKPDSQLQRKTIAYARVSSHDQKEDLIRQQQVLEMYCANQGWTFELISDLGSGMNYRKKGLNKLLEAIMNDEIGRLVFALCEAKSVEIVILNKGENLSFEEELAQDVLEIITVFSARLYGSRSKKNQKLIQAVKDAL